MSLQRRDRRTHPVALRVPRALDPFAGTSVSSARIWSCSTTRDRLSDRRSPPPLIAGVSTPRTHFRNSLSPGLKKSATIDGMSAARPVTNAVILDRMVRRMRRAGRLDDVCEVMAVLAGTSARLVDGVRPGFGDGSLRPGRLLAGPCRRALRAVGPHRSRCRGGRRPLGGDRSRA